MKKISFISMIALGAAMTACSSYDLPNPPGQTYPEPEVFEDGGVVLEQAATSLNLIELNNDNKQAELARVTDLVNFPDTYKLAFVAEVAKDDSYAGAALLDVVVDGDLVTVRPDALNGAICKAVTNDPAVRDIHIRYAAYAVNGDTKLRLGGNDVYYGSYTYSIKPFDPAVIIEDSYYLVGSFCNWDLSQAVKMNHTTDGSVYDSAVFGLQVEVDAAAAASGYEWKVVPASALTAGTLDTAFGVKPYEDNNLAGELIHSAGRDNAGTITNAGPYLITVDIANLTYNVNVALECLYVPGNGSSQSNFAKVQKLYTLNFITYQGMAQLRNNWFLTGQPKTSGIVYKSVDGTVTTKGLVTKGELTGESTGKNMKADADRNALHWISANLVQMTFEATTVNTVSVVGDHNGWNEKEAPELALTPNADPKKQDCLVWKGEVELNSEFKININHEWTIDFGGTIVPSTNSGTHQANLLYKGGNLIAPAPGRYEITVDFSTVDIATGFYTMTLVKK